MPNILLTGMVGEGSTDERFLTPLLRRTFEDLLNNSEQLIETYDPVWLGVAKGEEIVKIGRKAATDRLHIYCIHIDTDSEDYLTAVSQRLMPFLDRLKSEGIMIPTLPVMPVQETEAWMLGDVDILRQELRTDLTPSQLGLHGSPERYADPKQKLANVISTANVGRGTHLQSRISELYGPLGEKSRLHILESLPSYARFRAAADAALREVGYLR